VSLVATLILIYTLISRVSSQPEYWAAKPRQHTLDQPPGELENGPEDDRAANDDGEDLADIAEDRQQVDAAAWHKEKPAFRVFCGLTKESRSGKNARRLLRTWTSWAVHHLPDFHQWDYDVLKPYIGHCVPIQSYLRFFARGPPLLADRDSPNPRHYPLCLRFVFAQEKTPAKDGNPKLRFLGSKVPTAAKAEGNSVMSSKNEDIDADPARQFHSNKNSQPGNINELIQLGCIVLKLFITVAESPITLGICRRIGLFAAGAYLPPQGVGDSHTIAALLNLKEPGAAAQLNKNRVPRALPGATAMYRFEDVSGSFTALPVKEEKPAMKKRVPKRKPKT